MKPLLTVTLVALLVAPTLAQQAPEPKVAALIGLARTKHAAGDDKTAAGLFRQADRLSPFDAGLLEEWFWTEVAVSPTDAFSIADRVLRVKPGLMDIRRRAIDDALTARAFDLADRLAQGGEVLEAQAAVWTRARARVAEAQHDTARALALREKVAGLPSATADDMAAVAYAAAATGNNRRALEAWRQIPSEAREVNVDWSREFVRTLASVGPASSALEALTQRERVHGAAPELRAGVVDALARDRAYALALATVTPLLTGPDRARWLSRAAEFAVAAGNHGRTVDVLTALERVAPLGAEQLGWRANALLSLDRRDAARADIDRLDRQVVGCDARVLALREQAGDGLSLADAVLARSAGCSDDAAWRVRAAQYVLDPGHDARLLALISPVASDPAVTPAIRFGYGQALARADRTREAVEAFHQLLDSTSHGLMARTALVDVHLAHGDTVAAWSAAAPALADAPDRDTQMHWLRIGIDAGQAPAVLSFVTAQSPAGRGPLVAIEALARLRSGQVAAAVTLFTNLATDRFEPGDALAFIDAVDATEGTRPARQVAARFTRTESAWLEVVARRALLAARARDAREAERLHDRVATIDAERGRLLDAEIALAERRPAPALSAVAPLLAADANHRRALELQAAAHAAEHNWLLALEDTQRLLALRPGAALRLDEAEYTWRSHPSPAALDAFLTLVRTQPSLAGTTAAARALREVGRPADALPLFGPQAEWSELPLALREELAHVLAATGRDASALAVLEDDAIDTAEGSLLRARLTARVKGASASRRLFTDLAQRDDASADLYVAWADSEASAERTRVLTLGLARFPDASALLIARAADALTHRQYDDAWAAATHALTVAPGRLDAWTVAFDVASRRGQGDALSMLLDNAGRHFGSDVAGRHELVSHLTGLIDGPGGILAQTALAWANDTVEQHDSGAARLLRARVHVARGEWAAATRDAEAAERDAATARDALRLRADVLSYAGAYDASFAVYRTYLTAYPDDLIAARQLARVYGWAQRYDEARAQYASLVAAHPSDMRLRLEADAKSAYFSGRWQAAQAAYGRWLEVEPESEEARFEAAQAARAGGAETRAVAALEPLAVRQPAHRQSQLALDTWNAARTPGVQPFTSARESSGEQGRRTLTLAENGLTGGFWTGRPGRLWLGARANRVSANGVGAALTGTRMVGALRAQLSRSVVADAAIGQLDLGTRGVGTYAAGVRMGLGDRVSVVARSSRDGWLENTRTVREALATTDTHVALEVTAPRWAASSTLRHRSFSDDNDGWQVEGSSRMQLATGRSEWHAFTWLSHERYATDSQTYFAPARFSRADVGLEWKGWLSRPRFRDDRERSLTATYAFGVDSRQFIYHHPAVRFAYELRPGLAVEGRGSWLRSPEYRSTDVLVALRVGGIAPAVPVTPR